MEPESNTAEKNTEQSVDGESPLGQRVLGILGVAFVLVVYFSFRFTFDAVLEYLPEWIYYTLLGVGLLMWIGDLLRKASDWMEKDLARMDAKTKAERARLQESLAKKDT